MVNAAAIRNVVGVIGNVISFGLFLSPVPTFYKIIKKKDVEEFKPDPYLATLLNCAFWVFYGLPFVHPHSMLVVTINGVGLVIESIYIIIFCIYATSKGRKKVGMWLVGEFVFFAIIVGVAMGRMHLHGKPNRSLMVGIVCDIFNIMMYASPLTIMKQVITTKSVKYMPFWLSLTNFLNGCCWTAYALIHHFDIYVLISNGTGTFLGIIQLTLYAYYYFKGGNAESGDDDVSKPNGDHDVSKPTELPV